MNISVLQDDNSHYGVIIVSLCYSNVGKSALITRYCTGKFVNKSDECNTTIVILILEELFFLLRI